jgi:hypothetical protein
MPVCLMPLDGDYGEGFQFAAVPRRRRNAELQMKLDDGHSTQSKAWSRGSILESF